MGVPTTQPTPANSAHTDANQQFSIIAVSGTLGTADTAGTAPTVPIGANPLTGAVYTESTGGVAPAPASGTLNTLGTVGTVVGIGTVSNVGSISNVGQVHNAGTVQGLNTGTINLGTFVMPSGTITTIAAGTQQTLGTVGVVNSVAEVVKGTTTLVTRVGNVGTLEIGSVVVNTGTITTGSLTNIAMVHAGTHVHPTGTVTTIVAGTQNTLGTVGVVNNIVTGTLAAIASVAEVVKGTTTLVSTVTTVSNLTNGSVNILTGTLQSSGTTTGVGVVSNLTNGSVNLLTGTVTSLTNLAGGTVQTNAKPTVTVVSQGTLGTAGGSFFGTLSAASGAGTNHWVTNVDIVAQSGTADVRVLAGTGIAGTGVIAAGFFPSAGGGISKHFMPAFSAGANSELIYHFVGAGTAFITVNYFKTLT